MVHIESVRPDMPGSYGVWYRDMSGYRRWITVRAKDELDAFIQSKAIVEEKEMTIRWIIMTAIICVALLLMSMVARSAFAYQAQEDGATQRVQACVRAGKSFAHNSAGYICSNNPVFRTAGEVATARK